VSKRNKYNSGKYEEKRMADKLDDLAAFEDFQASILPKLRAGIKAGKSAVDMYRMVEAEAAARAITIGLTESDSGRALAAIQEILNRAGGKPTERKEIRGQFSSLSDDELRALARSEELDEESDPDTAH
jgi:hypothetical protein